MNDGRVQMYVNNTASMLKANNGIPLTSFYLIYLISYCSKYISILEWNKEIEDIDFNDLKLELINKVNRELFSNWEIQTGYFYQLVYWIKKNPPIETEEDILGSIYLKYAETAQRKKMGEHYTRMDLVDYILNEMDICKAEYHRMIDPACGSGNFIIGFLRRILYRNSSKTKTIMLVDNLLKENKIVGIDIQYIPCLIAKVRIIMELVKTTNYINPEVKIPIYQLDSLKDGHSILLPNQYDFVVTNPPYLRYQLIPHELRDIYKDRFKSATGRYDLYVLFMEKCIQLAKEDTGRITVLCSDKFMTSEYGKGIRSYIQMRAKLLTVIDLSQIYTFQAAVLSAVYFFKKEKCCYVNSDHNAASCLTTSNKNIISDFQTTPIWSSIYQDGTSIIKQELGKVAMENQWRLVESKTENIFEEIKSNKKTKPLGDIASKIPVGIQTTADDVFCNLMTRDYIEKNRLEEELLFPLLRGRNVKRWKYQWNGDDLAGNTVDTYILYPYIKTDGGTKTIQLEDYPNACRYLKRYKKLLDKRYYLSAENREWFEHLQPKCHQMFEQTKIITPDLASNCSFALDQNGFFCNGTIYCIILDSCYNLDDYKYLLGILNSNLINFFHKKLASVFLASRKYRFQSRIMRQYPIIMESRLSDYYWNLIDAVDNLLANNIEQQKSIESKINELVYKIYGISKSDIDSIENFIKGT